MRVPLRRPAALFAVLLAVAPLTACAFGSDPGPQDAANQFLAAFSGGDTGTASTMTDAAESAKALMDKVRGSIKPATVIAQVTKVDTPEGQSTAKATFEITWDVGRGRLWSYESAFDLVNDKDAWKVHWEPSILHPKLTSSQTIGVRDADASLAPVLDRDGTPLLQPERVVSVLFDKATAGDAPAIAGQLAAALSGVDATITAQSIMDGAAKADGKAHQVVALRDSDYQKVRSLIYDLPGVRFTAEVRLLAADKGLAPTLLPTVRKIVEDQVRGSAGWSVHTVDARGEDVEELYAKAAEPAKAVRVALSKQIQSAAQAAVAGEPTPSMIVALQPSTGEILAVAQNAPADAQGQLALTGRYPPGSTFKIVTAAAALKSGKAAADTPLPCPGTKVVDGREIPNSNKFDKGVVPLHMAFAYSCNTTFAELAVGMAPDELTAMAKQLGLGVDYVLPGVTTITGSVPPATNVVERAEDGFGQGKIVASPFGMAVVAATVASGAVPKPVLVRGAETKIDTMPEPLSAAVLDPVRNMMRDVVTSGTATALAGLGEVRGKTGTAQFGDGTHSHGWFVGYRGDLAFAVLLVDSGESTKAVQATARFLSALG